MERTSQQVALPGRHDYIVRQFSQNLYLLADLFYQRSSDEDGMIRCCTQHRDIQFNFEAVYLPAESIAFNDDIHGFQRLQGGLLGILNFYSQTDHTGAGPPDRKAPDDQFFQRLEKYVTMHQLQDSSAFSARHNQAV